MVLRTLNAISLSGSNMGMDVATIKSVIFFVWGLGDGVVVLRFIFTLQYFA
jgi:hypothetical protein